MNFRNRTDHDEVERRQYRATWFGTLSLGIICAVVLTVGASSIFNHPLIMLLLLLLTCPLSAWLATRCLVTAGAGSRPQAWIALALVVMIVGLQVIELSPYFPPSTWD